jgi:hypothetical protein
MTKFLSDNVLNPSNISWSLKEERIIEICMKKKIVVYYK